MYTPESYRCITYRHCKNMKKLYFPSSKYKNFKYTTIFMDVCLRACNFIAENCQWTKKGTASFRQGHHGSACRGQSWRLWIKVSDWPVSPELGKLRIKHKYMASGTISYSIFRLSHFTHVGYFKILIMYVMYCMWSVLQCHQLWGMSVFYGPLRNKNTTQ